MKINLSGTLPEVKYVKIRLQEIFSNLISNSIKYSKESGGDIKIGCNEMNDHYVFFIKDNGIGIKPEFHNEVFRIFSRINKNVVKDYSMGFGLHIVKRIVEQYGGKIWFESEPDVGTTFFFTVIK